MLNILYRDDYAIAVNKPAGIIVHGDGTGAETLTDLVRAQLAAADASTDTSQLQALQRLDRDTTGIVLFSLSKETQPAFDALVARHGADGMRKRYLAVVQGRFPKGETCISKPLGRDRHDARRMRVSRTGKPSLTRVRLLAQRGGYSLLVAELETGRKHQIRVHLASMGFPLVGDVLYGGVRNAGGLMLHAAALDFTHPVTGQRVSLCTDVPKRFLEYFSPSEAEL